MSQRANETCEQPAAPYRRKPAAGAPERSLSEKLMKPKVFISYSWSSQTHQDIVREWAERLVADGVDVVLDLFDLKEGHDKYAFMERMVTDPEVSHVLVVCDRSYAQKADARVKGVGTESQIISKEVYDKVEQSKFIPIVCEMAEDTTPFLPTFLKSRIWLNFSSPEAVNANWERLIRLLFGKPLNQKPALGKPPAYITDDTALPPSPARAKFSALRQAILENKKGLALYRRDFLEACISHADALRVRTAPDLQTLGQRILADCTALVQTRDHLVDWVLLESESAPSADFTEALLGLLERLIDLRSRPPEINQWNDAWFEAQALFTYETFLYVVAALLKTKSYTDLNHVFTSHYLLPVSERQGEAKFDRFDRFYAHSEMLNPVLAPAGQRLYSPAAELVKRQAQRSDIPLQEVIQADLLVLMMCFITPDTRWYPQMLYYSSYAREFPFFIRAAQHKHFRHLATITGIDKAEDLRAAVNEGQVRLESGKWSIFHFRSNLSSAMNLDKLDTLK